MRFGQIIAAADGERLFNPYFPSFITLEGRIENKLRKIGNMASEISIKEKEIGIIKGGVGYETRFKVYKGVTGSADSLHILIHPN